MSLLDWLFNWGDVVDVVHGAVRLIPAAIMFPVMFVIVQALMTVGDAQDLGNASAIRATLHGAHMDAHGLSWSLGVAACMTLWGVVARSLHRG